ncbi:MAG: glycoside hydrolase family 16 protein [Microthrixaceae bacterium]|nr:glycoside hydrolase family 16 protein [Microthrixaceae bacterium]
MLRNRTHTGIRGIRLVILVMSLFAGLVVWQSGIGSSAPGDRTVIDIASDATWRYYDRPGALPASWSTQSYTDTHWSSGSARLGYGNGGEATVIAGRQMTTYFRKNFVSEGNARSLTLWLVVDDGAVVYLNGTEVARDNMPSGVVTPTTRARSNRNGSAERRVRAFTLPTSALRAGTNVLAVEVHQNWARSSDLSFQAGLTSTLPSGGSTGPAPMAPSTTTPTPTIPPSTTTTVRPPTRPTTTIPTPPTTTPPPTTTVRPPSGVTWSDEFNGPLDTSVWTPYHNTYGDGNREMQCLTPANVTTSGGALSITSRKETLTCPNGSVRNYSSGFVGTRETGRYFPLYGRFEMRARLPHGQGLWPAFWLRHRNGAGVAEVDIMEYFHSANPGKTTATLHLDGRKNLSKKNLFFETPTASPGWHTWAVDITPDPAGVKFSFSLDGATYHSYVDTQHRWADSVDRQATWDIALNVAIGGNWLGDPEGTLGYLPNLNRCAQGGTPPNNCTTTGILRAQMPSTYQVDYVRYTAL